MEVGAGELEKCWMEGKEGKPRVTYKNNRQESQRMRGNTFFICPSEQGSAELLSISAGLGICERVLTCEKNGRQG